MIAWQIIRIASKALAFIDVVHEICEPQQKWGVYIPV